LITLLLTHLFENKSFNVRQKEGGFSTETLRRRELRNEMLHFVRSAVETLASQILEVDAEANYDHLDPS
jgi:hypothetical protein